jgi:hypothetical protein
LPRLATISNFNHQHPYQSMKQHTLLSPILAATSLSLLACASDSHASLVSLFTLDDTSSGVAVDSISGNNGIWQNGTNTNLLNTAGRVGGAADLTDAGGAAAANYFQLNIPQLIGANGITISLWINNRAQSSSGYNGIFMTRTFNGATGNSWGLAVENNGNERFDSRVNGPGIDSPDGALGVNGEWKHLTLVWDGVASTHTQYINGVQTNTGASIAGPIAGPASGPWYIGYDDCCGDTRDFDGAIDDIAVWNNALSAAQVAAIYQNGLLGIGVPEPSSTFLSLAGFAALLLRRSRARS